MIVVEMIVIASGIIVLCYFNTALSKVNIEYDHPSRVEDFFLLIFLFHHADPFREYILLQVMGTGDCCT